MLLLCPFFVMQNPETRTEIELLAQEKKEEQLEKLLGERMIFGTAG